MVTSAVATRSTYCKHCTANLALSIVLAPSDMTTGAGDTACKASLITRRLVE